MEVLITVVALTLFLALGIPVAFALASAGLLGIYLITGDPLTALSFLGTTPF
ncbi:MAG: TRAP transporter large permease, partial [Deltaproteobacteria bacterium]|nr:TRAP transporter large permease [Deltaproteobacteria bacterium]